MSQVTPLHTLHIFKSYTFSSSLQKSISSNISFCKIKIIFKSSTQLANFFRFKDKIHLCLHSCGRCNDTYYGKTCHHFKVRVGKHSGISPLTNKHSKSRKSTAVKGHMWCMTSEFWFLTILNKNLCHYICLISYTNILQFYDYLVSSFMHCYFLFVVFSNKIHAPKF